MPAACAIVLLILEFLTTKDKVYNSWVNITHFPVKNIKLKLQKWFIELSLLKYYRNLYLSNIINGIIKPIHAIVHPWYSMQFEHRCKPTVQVITKHYQGPLINYISKIFLTYRVPSYVTFCIFGIDPNFPMSHPKKRKSLTTISAKNLNNFYFLFICLTLCKHFINFMIYLSDTLTISYNIVYCKGNMNRTLVLVLIERCDINFCLDSPSPVSHCHLFGQPPSSQTSHIHFNGLCSQDE